MKIESVSVALVGAGYWGKKLLPKFLGAPGCSVKTVCELHESLRSDVERNFPGVRTTSSYEEALNDPEVNAVALATPPATHFVLARRAIEAGKHVWIEKPMAMTFNEGALLVRMARASQTVLFVDHTFLYDPLVASIHDLIQKGDLGSIYHLFFQRLNLGRIKRDSNVWWNSAPHDVSLLLYLLEAEPKSVTLQGYDYLQEKIEDLNIAVIEMEGGASALIYHNWLYPENSAKFTVIGSKKLLVYQGKFGQREASVYEYVVDTGNTTGPGLPTTIPSRIARQYGLERGADAEPLAIAVGDFVSSIRERRAPLSDGIFSLKVLSILEAGEASLRSGGRKVVPKLDGERPARVESDALGPGQESPRRRDGH